MFGGSLEVRWSLSGKDLVVVVKAPRDTTGTIMGRSVEGLGTTVDAGECMVYIVMIALP